MTPFDYSRPRDLAEAVVRGGDPDTVYIAGGTNMVDLMKYRVECPSQVIDINALSLRGIDDLPDAPRPARPVTDTSPSCAPSTAPASRSPIPTTRSSTIPKSTRRWNATR